VYSRTPLPIYLYQVFREMVLDLLQSIVFCTLVVKGIHVKGKRLKVKGKIPNLPRFPCSLCPLPPHLPISPAPYYILFNAVKCKTVFYLLKKHRTLLQINIIDCKIRRIKVKSHSSSEKDEYYGDFSCGFLICSVGSTWRSELVFS
jgi:hypothetical protein